LFWSQQWTHFRVINGDELPDLAVANAYSSKVSVLINNTAGSFLPPSYGLQMS